MRVIFKPKHNKNQYYSDLFWKLGQGTDNPIPDPNKYWDTGNLDIVKQIEEQWRPIEKRYFKLVGEITDTEWLHDEYYGYFLSFTDHLGFSDPTNLRSQEFTLSVGSIMNPTFFVGHELFHSHYYYVIDQLGLTKQANKTLLTEGVAALVLYRTNLVHLFPKTNFESSIDSYPVVRDNWETLLHLWEKRESFEGFMKEAVETPEDK